MNKINSKYKWDLTHITNNYDELDNKICEIYKKVEDIEKYKGKIIKDDTTFEYVTKNYYLILEKLEPLIMYSRLKYYEDMENAFSKSLYNKIEQLSIEIEERISFYKSEILNSDYEIIKKYISKNKNLKIYSFVFKKLFMEKQHTLSLEEEKIIAKLSQIFDTAEETFQMIDNIDIKFKDITDERNNKVSLTNSNYPSYIKSLNQRIRKETFYNMFNAYKKLNSTFASLLKWNVKKDFFISKSRNFSNPLKMKLFKDNIDEELYLNLIKKVHHHLKVNYDYLSIRKHILNIDNYHIYDDYVPLIKEHNKEYSYEDAIEILLKSLSPLGNNYIRELKELVNKNIIDVYSRENKMNGAYSFGSYKTNPYILLNYENHFSDVLYLAHEIGHSMHTQFSKKQHFHNYDYSTFLAEVASTVNELLVINYCIKSSKSKEEKTFFLNQLLDNIRNTLIRQTMFAEFELKIYNLESDGEVLTEELLSNIYYELIKLYYGNDIVVDEIIKYEWTMIPHFYDSFYVYKYATGISIALQIVKNILDKKENYAEKYIEFLSSGNNNFPLELLKKLDIDILNDNTIDNALETYKKVLEEFVSLL